MSDLTTAQRVSFDEIVNEFLHLYPRGSRMVAVAGKVADRSLLFAEGLAQVLREHENAASAVAAASRDEDALRADVVRPFRDAQDGTVLLVAGDETLLTPTARGMWHYTVWLLAGDEVPHTAASALVDVTDATHPTRRYTDYCAVPPSFYS